VATSAVWQQVQEVGRQCGNKCSVATSAGGRKAMWQQVQRMATLSAQCLTKAVTHTVLPGPETALQLLRIDSKETIC
jgi:hypothetical protein